MSPTNQEQERFYDRPQSSNRGNRRWHRGGIQQNQRENQGQYRGNVEGKRGDRGNRGNNEEFRGNRGGNRSNRGGNRGDRGGNRGDRGGNRSGMTPLPGQVGRITLATNHFDISFDQSQAKGLIYEIQTIPELEQTNHQMRKQLIHKIRNKVQQRIGPFVFYGQFLFAIASGSNNQILEYSNIDDFYIILKLVREFDFTLKQDQQLIKMYYNILVKNLFRALGLKQVTKYPKFYNDNSITYINEFGLQVWQGYSAALNYMNQNTNYMKMCLAMNFSSKIIQSNTVLDLIQRHIGKEQQLKDVIEGQYIICNYGNKRQYKVDKIETSLNPLSFFDIKREQSNDYEQNIQDERQIDKDNKYINYVQFYYEQYGIQIQEVGQPLLKVITPQKNIYLIPELVSLTGLPEECKNNARVKQSIKKNPKDSQEHIIQIINAIANNQKTQEMLRQYQANLSITPNMVDGQRFSNPTVNFGEQQISLSDNTNFNLNGRIRYPKDIVHWAILYNNRSEEKAKRLHLNLRQEAQNLQIPMDDPQQKSFTDFEYFKTIFTSFMQKKDNQLQIIVILLPSGRQWDQMYLWIKQQQFDNQIGSCTQVIRERTLDQDAQKVRSVVRKIMIQIGAKTGSSIWTLTLDDLQIPKSTMVIGIDVYHQTQKQHNSVMGFTASIHPEFTQYYSEVKQSNYAGHELQSNLQQCFFNALQAFFKETKERFLPDLIIVYRDGVSESMISQVKDHEVLALKQAINQISETYNPRFVYFSINKDTNMKFFRQEGSQIDNPLPGTVVYKDLTPSKNDFYLVSHYVSFRQGIARPSLYKVVDQNIMPDDYEPLEEP